MRLDDLIAQRPATLSFEFFPPKTESGWTQLRATVQELSRLGPDFFSVTYGAGGTSRDRTRAAVSEIESDTGVPSMAHLTCVGHSRDEIRALLNEYAEHGICNLLALRGDPPKGQDHFEPVADGCRYASELIELIGTDGRFAATCAAFPEGHPEASARQTDWQHLIGKFEAGACLALTQCFFSAAPYFEMMTWLEQAMGSRPRIVPGIMPARSWAWAEDFVQRFCPNTQLPEAMRAVLEPLGDDDASSEAGLAYTIDMCRELLRGGAPGLHIYTLNKPDTAQRIVSALRADGLLPEPVAQS
ncbi:MAG: methylenetetrahydrofolate reductase [Planctomycetota bacterium]|jgi:methylenetetrahydrofolate reductase (NADPH)|nr:methylenetetrahydrofolate reductase [Planctomycetota bacterium]